MLGSRARYKYPVVYFEKNLIFTRGGKDLTNVSGGECWAVYRVGGYTYEDFNSDDEKIDRLVKNSRAFNQVYQEAHLLELPVTNKIEDSINYMRGLATGELKPIALRTLAEAEAVLLQSGETKESNDYETYFIVKLKKPRTLKDIRDVAASFVKEPVRIVNELLSMDAADIYENEIKAYIRLEQSLRKDITKYLHVMEVNELDIERLLREPFFRGLRAPRLRGKEKYYDPKKRNYRGEAPWRPSFRVLEIGGQTLIRPFKRDILTLSQGLISNNLKNMEITHRIKGEEVKSHQMFVVLSHLPDIDFPSGREWIYKLRTSMDFPVWPSIRYVKKEYADVLTDINKRRKELDDQLEHSREANAKISQQYMEQDEDIDRARYEVESEKKPFLYTTVVIGVAADSLSECGDRAKAVQDFFDEMDVETQIPAGDQLELFCETLVGGRQYASDFILRLPPETLAGSMVGASTSIGNELGLPIGTDTSGKPVKFDIFKASRINESPSVTFTGGLGRGKSLLANLIALWAALLGARVLIADPKGERGNWSVELPELKPYINIIELTPARENRGKLDIYRVMIKSLGKAPSKRRLSEATKQASEYALSILGALCGYKTKDEKMEYLADAVNLTGEEENPCLSKIIPNLQKLGEQASGDEKKIYLRIAATINNRIKNTAYAHILFGDGTEEAVDITAPINILQTQNLTVPDENKPEEEFTFQEMVGMATLIAISAVGMHFATQAKELLKIYLQDEASVFKRSAQGKAMFNRLVKMGRSENAPIFIIGQNISDLGDSEDVRANIGTRFCFGTKTMAEAKSILKYIGLDEEDKDLQKLLVDLPTGVCLMRDIYGRIKFIATDYILEKFLKAFDTRPAKTRLEPGGEDESGEAEESFPDVLYQEDEDWPDEPGYDDESGPEWPCGDEVDGDEEEAGAVDILKKWGE